MPLNKNIIPVLIVITLLLWLFENKFKYKVEGFKNPFFLISVGYYLLHIIGLFYSSNAKAGSFDLEQKLSLLIFPLIFFSESVIDDLNLNRILKSFVLGCILSGIICALNAVIKNYYYNDTSVFYYAQFSVIMHTSYYAMYLCFSIALILFKREIFQNSIIRVSTLLFLIMLILLISSKSGLFTLIIIIGAKFLHEILIYRNFMRVFIMFLVIVISSTILYLKFPKSLERVKEMNQTIISSSSEVNTTTSRIVIWKLAAGIISKNYLIGVGTGDVKDALKQEYNKQSLTAFADKNLNAHNQYLQSFIAFGLLGILLLMGILIAVLFYSYQTNKIEGTMLAVVIMFNLLFESMLETQAGVVFISFFLMLYLSISTQQIRKKNITIAS